MPWPATTETIPGGKTDQTTMTGDHPGHHNTLADIANRIISELGTDPSGSYPTVKARLDAVGASSTVQADYVISMSAGQASAKGAAPGLPDVPANADAGAVLQACITNLGNTNRGTIVFQGGDYQFNSVPAIPRGYASAGSPNRKWWRILGGGGVKITLSTAGPRLLDFTKIADHDTFERVELGGFYIDANSVTTTGHVVAGNYTPSGFTSRVNFDRIWIHDIEVINVPTSTFPTSTPDRRVICFVLKHPGLAEGTASTMTNFLIERCNIRGGNYGIELAGTTDTAGATANLQGYDLLVRNCQWDSLTFGQGAAGIFLGSQMKGDRWYIQNCSVKNSGDVGFETDSGDYILLEGCYAENCGAGFYYNTFSTAMNPKGQRVELRDCKSVITVQTGSRNFVFQSASAPYNTACGAIVMKNCVSIHKPPTSPYVAQQHVYLYDGIDCRYVEIDGLQCYAEHPSSASSSQFDWIPLTLRFNSAGQDRVVVLRNIDLYLKAAMTSTGYWTVQPFELGGKVIVDADGVNVWREITGDVSPGNTQLLNLSLGTQTLRGTFRNFRLVATTNNTVYMVNVGTGLTASGPIRCENFDASVASGAQLVQFAGGVTTATKEKFIVKGGVPTTWPIASTTITPGASPYAYENLDGYPQTVTVSGGTVSAIDISQDGSTYRATGETAGVFHLDPGQFLKVTYSGTPTMTKIPDR